MKKIFVILSLLLCLTLLSACTVQVLSDVADQLAEGSASAADAAPEGFASAFASASAPDAGDATPGDAEEPPATDPEDVLGELRENAEMEEPIPASAGDAEELLSELPLEIVSQDYSQLTAADCVADADAAVGALPRILVDCPGAESINEDIEGTFRHLVDDGDCTLYYESFKNGSILSVLVVQQYDGGSSYYTPYNLDLATGQRIGGEDLLARLGADREIVGDCELAVMEEEFRHMYGGMEDGGDADFYQEQYDRTVSPDNAEFSRLWLGGNGELWFAARLYSLAGAEFYEYPMSTGLSF